MYYELSHIVLVIFLMNKFWCLGKVFTHNVVLWKEHCNNIPQSVFGLKAYWSIQMHLTQNKSESNRDQVSA